MFLVFLVFFHLVLFLSTFWFFLFFSDVLFFFYVVFARRVWRVKAVRANWGVNYPSRLSRETKEICGNLKGIRAHHKKNQGNRRKITGKQGNSKESTRSQGNPKKSKGTRGNPGESDQIQERMTMDAQQTRKAMKITEIDRNLSNFMKIKEGPMKNQWKAMRNQWRINEESMKINENQWKSMKINEN